ncbi:hypothetical protein [Nostoc sp. FACHB-110]|uniref:hypothetical protein n=1 Tax=Nostoc sp. FACHB-110 TaxID=2692834 RepID=UPI00168787C8|nr:hypothetical protein [Nostoc sp. FACHB-110]MBD2441343.1 hypothetical protein [Nostoc sp. FACHB-110]
MNIDLARQNLAQALTLLADYCDHHEYDQSLDEFYKFVYAAQSYLLEQQQQDKLVVNEEIVPVSNE